MQIEPHTAFVEMYLDAALFGFVHERGIQVRARNRIDHFCFIFSVGLKRKLARERVHHAAFHRDDDIAHGFP